MGAEHVYLSLDIGASSGRLFAVINNDEKIYLDEISRFDNKIYQRDDKLYWDFGHLFLEIIEALRNGLEKYPNAKSLGIDTWGVDYGLIDYDGNLLENPRCYRDQRGFKAKRQLETFLSNKHLYELTGIQQLHFNTIYQLFDDYSSDKEKLTQTKHILLIPDLIAYYLTGEVSTEITNASTTALFDSKKQDWITHNHDFFNLTDKFPALTKPSLLKGYLKSEFNLKDLPVISVCSHDTASAFISVKNQNHQVIISSGTWSLVGKNIEHPILNDDALSYGFTNEIGMFNHIRFLKNVMGLWIVNQIKAELEKQQESISFFELEKKAITAEPFQYFIDPDDTLFIEPGQMIHKINTYFKKTNQQQTNDISIILRAVYESLAFKYRLTIERLETITEEKIDSLIIIGGGNQSDLLNQFTANLTKKNLFIGPSEATVLGNALAQMYFFKDIKSLKSGQNLIELSFGQKLFEPDYCSDCEQAYLKFKNIIGNEE